MATEQKQRPISINEQEIQLLKDSFASNEELLIAIRGIFLGFKVSDTNKKIIQSLFTNPLLKDAFRKKTYPMLSSDAPIGEAADFWLGTETQILGKDINEIAQVIGYKDLALKMFEKGFEALSNPFEVKVDFSYDPAKDADPFKVQLLARNQYVKTIESALAFVKVVAGTKSETVEEAKKRIEKDSAK